MSKSIYIVNPKADFPTYFASEVYEAWGLQSTASIADLAIATLAGMVPDDFEVKLCDETISKVDLDSDSDYVALTGKISQWARMQVLAREFRNRGKTVIIGGPFASLCPETVAEHCDILVRGEVEEIAGGLFSDLKAGSWKEEYEGTRPSLDLTPLPRWDLYPNDQVRIGTIQTSRGCPFECEFCDVIQYLGRLQRFKSVDNVLREVEVLYNQGYRSILLADDNFTVARKRAKELLAALRDWNHRQQAGRVTFLTQLSIDAAKDEEMLRLCAEAGLIHAFIGLETPNEESLRESKKPQNLGVNLVEQVQRFLDHGIMIWGGMIVGFDSDDIGIFRRQYEFATAAALPVVTMGALVAPAATPLYTRMEAEGRLVSDGTEVAATPWNTNIVPQQMTRQELFEGTKWLAAKLYHPSTFGERVLRFINRLGERRDPKYRVASTGQRRSMRSVDQLSWQVVRSIGRLGAEEAKMVERVIEGASRKPQVFEFAVYALVQYAQIRFMYQQGQFWEAQLASETHAFTGMGSDVAQPAVLQNTG